VYVGFQKKKLAKQKFICAFKNESRLVFCFARFIIAKGREKCSFSQVHYQQTNCWNNMQMYLKYGSEMLHFYKTNVAYLQVLLICRGNGVRIGTENF
jgi:hypothetical protein